MPKRKPVDYNAVRAGFERWQTFPPSTPAQFARFGHGITKIMGLRTVGRDLGIAHQPVVSEKPSGTTLALDVFSWTAVDQESHSLVVFPGGDTFMHTDVTLGEIDEGQVLARWINAVIFGSGVYGGGMRKIAVGQAETGGHLDLLGIFREIVSEPSYAIPGTTYGKADRQELVEDVLSFLPE